ncbi:uncharacterized protein [Dendrobates tinctorius]|uniref:uncharacterized protein isoform X2 n=1 Tax=Dendrobates tinctorius TaxID=92724 RepID=UPI003CC9EC38
MEEDGVCGEYERKETESLFDFIEDPDREESVIGLQYVVDVKMLDSGNGAVKCNLCSVSGKLATMKEHLVGVNHIKRYMEKHYFSVFQNLRKSNNPNLAKIFKDYAKEIERAEGKQVFKVEYVSTSGVKKEQENWVAEQEERESPVEQNKSQVLDKRQMALNYSENFKISSREEAKIVLNLTQHLSDQLEQYFFKYKGLKILDSTRPDSISTKSIPASTSFPSGIPENLHTEKSATNQGMKSPATEMAWHTEDSSSPVCTSSFSTPIQPENGKGVKRKPEESQDASYKFHAPLSISSPTESSSRKKSNYMEHYDFPTMHSSSNTNIMVSPQQSSSEVSSSHSSSIADTYRKSSVPNEKVSKTFGGEMQLVKDTLQNSISQKRSYDNVSNIKAVQETKSLNDAARAKTFDLGAEENTAVPGPSCSTSNCSLEPSSETPSTSSSSQPQGKTSKSLSPEILQLLKGQDASTVTNILRTLSPFYPALQDINLDMLSQVLVNTGVLD